MRGLLPIWFDVDYPRLATWPFCDVVWPSLIVQTEEPSFGPSLAEWHRVDKVLVGRLMVEVLGLSHGLGQHGYAYLHRTLLASPWASHHCEKKKKKKWFESGMPLLLFEKSL